jgi:hypothetical protein
MKRKIIIAFFALAASLSANASITLTNQNVPIAGSATAAVVPNATATSKTFNWQTNTACINYSFGVVTATGNPLIDQSFAITANTPIVTICLVFTSNYTNCTWSAAINSGGVIASGTLTTAQCTAAYPVYTGPATALRDAADYFASSTNAVVNTSGTSVTWVSGSHFTGQGAVTAGNTVLIGSGQCVVAASPAPTSTTFSCTLTQGTQSSAAAQWAAPGQGNFLPGTQNDLWGAGDL